MFFDEQNTARSDRQNTARSNEQNGAHSFFSRSREGIEIEGVSDAVSFDEGGAVLETVCGSMAIEGEGLHVTVLDLAAGKVEISGKINGVYYFESKPSAKRGLFGRKSD